VVWYIGSFPLIFVANSERGFIVNLWLGDPDHPLSPISASSGGGTSSILWFGYFGGLFNINMESLPGMISNVLCVSMKNKLQATTLFSNR
jgi:hypothetical protein